VAGQYEVGSGLSISIPIPAQPADPGYLYHVLPLYRNVTFIRQFISDPDVAENTTPRGLISEVAGAAAESLITRQMRIHAFYSRYREIIHESMTFDIYKIPVE
jgi:hypothetical protein